jgi:hypothetical protein
MPGPLREEVVSRFPWLFDDLGFRVVEHDYSHRSMGSGYVVLESDSLRIKFVNDRGSIYPEVSSPHQPQRWIELGLLWVVLTGDRPAPQLDGWAWFLRDHLRELVDALGPRFAVTNEAVLLQERENQETLARYRASSQSSFIRIPMRFYRGPLGWILAAILLVWIISK